MEKRQVYLKQEAMGLPIVMQVRTTLNLLPKKRFENQNFNSWQEGSELNEESKTEESKTVSILAVVISHTSCPDNTLAYYYNYNSSSK